MSVPFHIMTGMRDGQVRPNESFGHTFSHSPFHFHKTVKLNSMRIISEEKKIVLPCFVVIYNYYCRMCSVKKTKNTAQLSLK